MNKTPKYTILDIAEKMEDIKDTLSFIFLADQAIMTLVESSAITVHDSELSGMINAKNMVLSEVAQITKSMQDIKIYEESK